MKSIKHREIYNKLRIFEVAGVDTNAFNTAIPQKLYEMLQSIGLENPGSWFVTDCNNILPKLRHVGEALFLILHNRRKANGELIPHLIDAEAAIHATDADKIVLEFIRDWQDGYIADECDAGMLDLNAIVALIVELFARGVDAGRKEQSSKIEKAITELEKSNSHWTEVRAILKQ